MLLMTVVESKMSDVSNLVKKPDYHTKIADIENNYITTADYNIFTKNIVAERIKSEGLVNNSAIAGFINNAGLNEK